LALAAIGVPLVADASGTSFSGWGNSGFATRVYSVGASNPDETIHLLDTVKMGSIQNVYKALYPGHRNNVL